LRDFFGSPFGAHLKKFLRFDSLGGLYLAVEKFDLFGLHPVSTQERFKRVHQKHLDCHEFREDVHGHFMLVGQIGASQQHLTSPFAKVLPANFGGLQKGLFFSRSEPCCNTPRAGLSAPQPGETVFDSNGIGCHFIASFASQHDRFQTQPPKLHSFQKLQCFNALPNANARLQTQPFQGWSVEILPVRSTVRL
jgi:hypothetical protein